jgi:hypothetical protein
MKSIREHLSFEYGQNRRSHSPKISRVVVYFCQTSNIDRIVAGEPHTHVQDWNYLHTNDFELTLELGCVKYPEHGQLAAFWQENREPLLKYLEAVHLGVKGGHQICIFFLWKVRILRPIFQLCFSLFTRNIIRFL